MISSSRFSNDKKINNNKIVKFNETQIGLDHYSLVLHSARTIPNLVLKLFINRGVDIISNICESLGGDKIQVLSLKCLKSLISIYFSLFTI